MANRIHSGESIVIPLRLSITKLMHLERLVRRMERARKHAVNKKKGLPKVRLDQEKLRRGRRVSRNTVLNDAIDLLLKASK